MGQADLLDSQLERLHVVLIRAERDLKEAQVTIRQLSAAQGGESTVGDLAAQVARTSELAAALAAVPAQLGSIDKRVGALETATSRLNRTTAAVETSLADVGTVSKLQSVAKDAAVQARAALTASQEALARGEELSRDLADIEGRWSTFQGDADRRSQEAEARLVAGTARHGAALAELSARDEATQRELGQLAARIEQVVAEFAERLDQMGRQTALLSPTFVPEQRRVGRHAAVSTQAT